MNDSNQLSKSKQSNYRIFLLFSFRLLVFIGFIFIITPVVSILFDGDTPSKSGNNPYLVVNLGGVQAGELKKIQVAYIPVWIYKRRDNEIEQLSSFAPLLVDPESKASIQPVKLRNQYRSYATQYFVFKPIESIRGCNIRYLDAPNAKLALLLSEMNLSWSGGFTESCFGSIYDLSGRRYQGTGKAGQKNLAVPEYSIRKYSINNTKQLGDVIQFEFKTMLMDL